MRCFRSPETGSYLRYLDFPGADPACVYIHGLGGAGSSEFPHIATHPLLRKRHAVLIDLLGCGYSDRPKRFDYTLEAHAQTVARLLDHLELEACAVIGHSMGGAVAITLAAARPDLAARLIVAEGNLDPGGGFMSKPIAAQPAWFFRCFGRRAMLRAVRRRAHNDPGLLVYLGSLSLCAPHALYRSAKGLVAGTVPTMREHFLGFAGKRVYIFGEKSLPDPDQKALAEAGVKVFVVPAAGHGMMHDNPDGFAEALAAGLID